MTEYLRIMKYRLIKDGNKSWKIIKIDTGETVMSGNEDWETFIRTDDALAKFGAVDEGVKMIPDGEKQVPLLNFRFQTIEDGETHRDIMRYFSEAYLENDTRRTY